MIDDLAIVIHGNLSPFQYRLSHVHFDQFSDDLWTNDTCQSFDFQLALFRKVVVVNIFGKTANAVAAHFHLAYSFEFLNPLAYGPPLCKWGEWGILPC